MKRAILLLALMAFLLAGCSPIVEEDPSIDIYASFYPIYALVDGITENVPDVYLHCLVQPQDGCLRNYQLSDWDLYLMGASADAVIMGGRGLESFESMLFGWGDKGPAVSAVLYNLELYNQDDEAASGEDASHFDGANPHLYMSLDGAAQMLESIAASLSSMDPVYAGLYSDNLQNSLEKISDLQKDISNTAASVSGKKVIVMNEALVYTARDFDLDMAVCYERESGVGLYDNELDECLNTLKESGASVILIEKQAPDALVKALEGAGFTVAQIDIFSDHAENGGFGDYLETQRKNAAVIGGAFENNIG